MIRSLRKYFYFAAFKVFYPFPLFSLGCWRFANRFILFIKCEFILMCSDRSMLSRNNGELVFDWSDSCPITRHQSYTNNGELVFDWSDSCPITRHQPDINNGELVYDWSDSCPIPRHQSDSNHIHKALLYSGSNLEHLEFKAWNFPFYY